MNIDSWLYRDDFDARVFNKTPHAEASLRLFPLKSLDEPVTMLSAKQPEAFLRQAMTLAAAKGATSFEFQSLEEAGYSVKGVLDCHVVPNWYNERGDLEQMWGVQEYFRDKPIGERFFYPIKEQFVRRNSDLSDYWHSRYFTFGLDIGSAVSLANMRFVWRKMIESRIALVSMTLKQIMEISPGEERPPIILASDLFGTMGLLFHEEKMKSRYLDLWEQVSAVETVQILDCELLLETEKELAYKARSLIVKLMIDDDFLRELTQGEREDEVEGV
jgi:hypothetical protein